MWVSNCTWCLQCKMSVWKYSAPVCLDDIPFSVQSSTSVFWPLILFNWACGSHINIFISFLRWLLLGNEIMFKASENVKELKYLVMKVTNGSLFVRKLRAHYIQEMLLNIWLVFSIQPIKCQDFAVARALFNWKCYCGITFSFSDTKDVVLIHSCPYHLLKVKNSLFSYP